MTLPARVAAALVVLATATFLPATPALAGPRDQQWYLDAMDVPQAQQVAKGAGVTIGLLTNGYPAAHPDVAGAMLPVKRFKNGLGGGSVVDAPTDYPLQDDVATARAGLMAARGGPGLLGVAPAAKVQPVICPGTGDDTETCMRWLVDNGSKVIFLSQALFTALDPGFDGMRYALAHDVVVVMSLSDGAELPAELRTGVILVGGSNKDTQPAGDGEPDRRVTVRAPGGDIVHSTPADQIVTLDPRSAGGYGHPVILNGDSSAAALVTGVVALVRSQDPAMTAPSAIDRILKTATDLGAPGRDNVYGYGQVDAGRALSTPTPPAAANPLGDPGEPHATWLTWQLVTVVAVIVLLLAAALLTVVMIRTRRRRLGPEQSVPSGTP
ncbi:S8 family serine peptidase [Actinoplanes sp. NPDC049265]|uniref:S8 family peptidase n=1 Tax=Actinoplanes sp. NPDC049265 TaxID=3363902 RepID=UPI00371C0A92